MAGTDRPGFWPERGKRSTRARMIAVSIKLVRGTALHSDRVANPRIVISSSQKAASSLVIHSMDVDGINSLSPLDDGLCSASLW